MLRISKKIFSLFNEFRMKYRLCLFLIFLNRKTVHLLCIDSIILDGKLHIKINLALDEKISMDLLRASWAVSVRASASSITTSFMQLMSFEAFFLQNLFIFSLTNSTPPSAEVFKKNIFEEFLAPNISPIIQFTNY